MSDDRIQDESLKETNHEIPQTAESGVGAENVSQQQVPRRGLEGFYENFRGVPLKYIDAFIVFCIVALIAVIAHGVLRARGIL